jgi:hypothetical protein
VLIVLIPALISVLGAYPNPPFTNHNSRVNGGTAANGERRVKSASCDLRTGERRGHLCVGVATGNATFETQPTDWESWDANHRSDLLLERRSPFA